MMDVININQKFGLFADHWAPKVVGELNGQFLKLAKLKGSFTWHRHDKEDELFYVIKGVLTIELRDKKLTIRPGECVIIPKGVEHKPLADQEVWLMLFEPKGTLNTGNKENEMTKKELDWI
jgi:mannose-6-phosphate isomerase-like protein (cupin superfamily)